nr:MAG TPA: hypothetical protein [Caudoviricetes sp.]
MYINKVRIMQVVSTPSRENYLENEAQKMVQGVRTMRELIKAADKDERIDREWKRRMSQQRVKEMQRRKGEYKVINGVRILRFR